MFLTLQVYLGGYYANDFNQFGRTWQVNLQADPQFRTRRPSDVRQLKVRNTDGRDGAAGQRRRASATSAARRSSSATTCITAAAINGGSLPGVSSGDGRSRTMDDVGRRGAAAGRWTSSGPS